MYFFLKSVMKQFLKDFVLFVIVWVLGAGLYFLVYQSQLEITNDYSFMWSLGLGASSVIVVPRLLSLFKVVKK
jgi:predicted membrane channel-forming protein YqfA (hemolysin III family)